MKPARELARELLRAALAAADPGSAVSRVLRLEVVSRILGEARRVLVYSPAGLAHAELPHVLYQDGKAYFAWGRAPRILDHLLATDQIRAAHLIFVPPQQRTQTPSSSI